jgi:hypothetical protein
VLAVLCGAPLPIPGISASNEIDRLRHSPRAVIFIKHAPWLFFTKLPF